LTISAGADAWPDSDALTCDTYDFLIADATEQHCRHFLAYV